MALTDTQLQEMSEFHRTQSTAERIHSMAHRDNAQADLVYRKRQLDLAEALEELLVYRAKEKTNA